MNVAITGMEASAGLRYFPKREEVAITLGLVALAFTLFWLAVKHLPIYDTARPETPPMAEHRVQVDHGQA